jgi:sodium-coupled neutral amino acid transporter 10
LLVIYDELPDATNKKMSTIIDAAVALVFTIYFFAGVFGYIAFCHLPAIHGNILTNVPSTFASELVTLGFLICVLIGYPFMVFPCRSSLNTLLFAQVFNFI